MKNLYFFLVLLILSVHGKAQYTTVGTTTAFGNDCFRLTQALNTQNGSVWNNSAIDLNQSFDFHLELYFGTNNGGADGIAFIIHNQPTGTGTGGGGMGYGTITPSVAVEFDTWTNGGLSDPSFDHTAIQTNGNGDHTSTDNLAGPVQVLTGVTNIEDGNNYNVRVSWDAPSQTMEVYVNCQLRMTYTGDIVANVFNGNPSVYWGLTASTGGANNEHRVCMQSISADLGSADSTLICSGDTTVISPILISPTADFTWTPGIFISDSTAATPQVFPPVTTTYYVEIDDTCGITHDTITVLVTNQYDAAFSVNDTFCVTDPPFTMTAITALGYYAGNGVIDSLGGIFHPDSAGVGTHPITHIIPGNCANDSIVNVTVLGLPDATITAPDELCISDTVTLSAATNGGTWGGSGIINSTTGQFSGSIGVGNQIITYTLNQPCYSQSKDTVRVVQPYTPNILSATLTLCEGDSIAIPGIPNNGTLQSSGTPIETWSGNGIIAGSNGLFDANITGPGGPYTVYYTVEMANGSCAGTDSALVTVFANPNATFLTGPYCDNDEAFTNLQPGTGGGNWTVTAIAPATDTFDPGFFKPADVDHGQYIVQYDIPDAATANGCGNSHTDTVTILQSPTAPNISPDSICYYPPVVLEAPVQFDSLIWFTDPNGDDTLTKGGTYLLEEGDPLLDKFPIKLYTQAFNGICSSEIEASQIRLFPVPTADMSTVSDTFTVPVELEIQNLSSMGNVETFDWDLGFYGTTTERNPFLAIDEFEVDSFIVELITTNEFGCMDTAYKTIYLDVNSVWVWPPNVMTVNGDGCNDVFGNNTMSNCQHSGDIIPFVTNAKDYDVLIYNRWGEKIYEFGQDGYWDGGDYPAGTYFYVIDVTAFDDAKSTFTGHITLLKD